MVYKKNYKKNNKIQGNSYVKKVARQEAQKVISREIETKTHDTAAYANTCDSLTGYVRSMTFAIGQGITDSSYIGSKISPIGLGIRWYLERVDVTNSFRMIVMQVKTTGIPTWQNTLYNISGIAQFNYFKSLHKDYDDTFRILYDKVHTINNDKTVMNGKIWIKGNRLNQIAFTGATGTTPEKAGLYFMVLSDSIATTHPYVSYYSRLYYKDA